MPSLLGQVNVRLFSEQKPVATIFSVVSGTYELTDYRGLSLSITKDELLAITFIRGKIAVKYGKMSTLLCDSISLQKGGDDCLFSLRTMGDFPLRRYYSGDLICRPDMGSLVFVNTIDIEAYIAGVVKAEGGVGRHKEYIKTQAIIARTYMYRYKDKHAIDGYDLCDGVHCQAFHGITTDASILAAVKETEALVIVGTDSLPIIAAFHSNCGGETVSSEDVWLSKEPYLRAVKDPHCATSNNAKWTTSIPLNVWMSYLNSKGCEVEDKSLLNVRQSNRMKDYKVGSFSIPFRQLRTDFNLRSTLFSVTVDGNNVVLTGKGYGHGVGLCQEGAMSMAKKGMTFEQIISFYYTGVSIININDSQ